MRGKQCRENSHCYERIGRLHSKSCGRKSGSWQNRRLRTKTIFDAVQGIDPERSRELLTDWQSRGVDLRTTDELLAEIASGS